MFDICCNHGRRAIAEDEMLAVYGRLKEFGNGEWGLESICSNPRRHGCFNTPVNFM